jgi:hypothetical protein
MRASIHDLVGRSDYSLFLVVKLLTPVGLCLTDRDDLLIECRDAEERAMAPVVLRLVQAA